MIHDDPRIDLIEVQIEALGARETWRIARFVAGHLMHRTQEAMWRAITRTAASAYGTLAFGALSIMQSGVIIALAWR